MLAQLVHLEDILLKKDGYSSSEKQKQHEHLRKLHHYVTVYLEGNDVQDILVFDSNFGGIVTREGLMDSGADFGNGW